jgi:hypothetical protein
MNTQDKAQQDFEKHNRQMRDQTKKWLRNMLRARHLDYLRTLNPIVAKAVMKDITAFIDFVCPPELTPQEVELANLKARAAELEDELRTKPIVGNDRRNISQEFYDAVMYGLRAAGQKCDVRSTNAMCKMLHTNQYIAVMERGLAKEVLNPHACGFDVASIPYTIAKMHGK